MTIPLPSPERIVVPEKTQFRLSASGVSFSTSALASLFTGRDSPVKEASLTIIPYDSTSRISAGTRTPSERMITSPTTTSLVCISCCFPSRKTFVVGSVSSRKRAIVLSVLNLLINSTPIYAATTKTITIASTGLPKRSEMPPMDKSTIIIGSFMPSRISSPTLVGLISVRVFVP